MKQGCSGPSLILIIDAGREGGTDGVTETSRSEQLDVPSDAILPSNDGMWNYTILSMNRNLTSIWYI